MRIVGSQYHQAGVMIILDVLTGCWKDMDRFEISAIAQVCSEPGFDLLVNRVPVASVFLGPAFCQRGHGRLG